MLFKYKKCGNCNKKVLKQEALKSEHGFFCSSECCQKFHKLMEDVNKTGLDNCCG